jgi:hypothetical protein
MWRSAENANQKKAILNMLIPITWENFFDAVVAFCGDENGEVSDLAFEKLLQIKPQDIKKRITPNLSTKSLESIFKASPQLNAPQLILPIIYSKKALPVWITRYLKTKNIDFWNPLVKHNDFLMFSEDVKQELEKFLTSVDIVVLELYKEHFQYITKKELNKFRETYIHYNFAENFQQKIDEEDEQNLLLIEDDDEIISFEDETENLNIESNDEIVDFEDEIPDFMISDSAFSGLSLQEAEEQRQTLQQLVAKMTVGQKIKLATTGNLEVRKMLLKDPRQMVAKAVLSNARITEKEIEAIIQSNSSSRELIDTIANSRDLTKKYRVKLALVMNPKTPIRVALRFLDLIRMSDLKKIAKSRNIPNVIKVRAMKKIK